MNNLQIIKLLVRLMNVICLLLLIGCVLFKPLVKNEEWEKDINSKIGESFQPYSKTLDTDKRYTRGSGDINIYWHGNAQDKTFYRIEREGSSITILY